MKGNGFSIRQYCFGTSGTRPAAPSFLARSNADFFDAEACASCPFAFAMPAMNDQNRCQSGISQPMVCGAGRCAFVRTASIVAHLRRRAMRREGREYLLDFQVFAPSIFNARFTMTGANVRAVVSDHEWKSRRPSNGATVERRAHDAG